MVLAGLAPWCPCDFLLSVPGFLLCFCHLDGGRALLGFALALQPCSAALSSAPSRAGAICPMDCLRGGVGVEEAKGVVWLCRSFQLLVLSPDSCEVGDSVTLSESCAHVLSQFPQGAFNQNTVVAGG